MITSKSGLSGIEYQAIFDASLDAAFILDAEGHILDANKSAVKRYGYSLDELKLMNASDLAGREVKRKVPSKLKKILKSGDIFEWVHKCKDGSELPVEVFSQPITLHGKPVILSRVRDISPRKKLESALQDKNHFLERILDTEPGTVYIFDLASQHNVYVNQHWLGAYGYSVEETQVMGADLIKIFHPDDLPVISAHHEAWRDARDDETRIIEYRIRDKQGNWHWLNSREKPFTRDAGGKVSQILGIAHDCTELRKMEEERNKVQREHIMMLEAMTDGFVELDKNWCYRYLNKRAADLLEREQSSLIGKNIWTEFPEGVGQPFQHNYAKAMTEQQVICFENYYKPLNRWYENRLYPSAEGLVILFQDVTERKRAEILLGGQSDILEMIASDIALPETLDALIRFVEKQSTGLVGSILLLDEDGVHVRHGAAPSLPQEFIEAIDGQPIGPQAGSCGTAAYLNQPVYVEDISSDPLWKNYKAAALPHGLRACWSTPIVDAQGAVLGTFAMYYREPGLPRPEHIRLIDIVSHVASIAIISHRTVTTQRESEARFRSIIEASPVAMAMNEERHKVTLLNPKFIKTFSYTLSDIPTLTEWWLLAYPDAEYRQRVKQEWKEAVEKAQRNVSEFEPVEYRVTCKDGSVRDIRFSMAQLGRATLVILYDLTEIKLAEKALRESEGRYRTLFEYAPDGIVIADSNSNYLEANPSMCDMLGYTREEIIELNAIDTVVQAELKYIEPALKEVVANDEHFSEWQLRRKDGSTFPAEVIIATMPDGNLLGMIRDISERKSAEARVQRLTQLYAALSQCNQAIVRCRNEAELFPHICQDAVNFGGMKMAWIGMLDEASKFVKPVASFGSGIEYLDGLEISIDENIQSGRGPTGTAMRENTPFWCQDFQHDPDTSHWHERAEKFGWEASAALPLLCNGVVVGSFTLYTEVVNAFDESAQALLVEMAMDISYALDRFAVEAESIKAAEALRKSEEHLRTIIETEPECVKVVAQNGELLEMNAAGLAMLEAETLEQARQYFLLDYILPEYRDDFKALHQRVMNGEHAELEFEITGLKGTRRWLATNAAPLRDTNGKISTLLGITRDITERKQAEARITYLANFDALTGLPNRAQLDYHLNYALSLAKRSNGQLAVMFMDIDRFKDINDTLGHSIGDAFLVEVAKRLKQVLREQDTASRLGGDEFMLILPGTDALGVALVAQKLLNAISMPYRSEQYDLVVTASIGIALYPTDGVDLDTLSRSADTAMYQAKREGRNGYRFFTTEMQASAKRNMQLVFALRKALQNEELQVHYQPQVSLPDGRIIGAEALLRWRHPELGDISPAEFIPVAEDSGLILPIGEWVLRTAVQQLKRWIDNGQPPIVIAVNLSAVQFRHPSLPEMVTRILEEIQLPPEYLELELTEGVAMHDPQGAIEVMNKLHERGIRMSIDDFGTGYSSLNYLKKFKVYKLKIDQSFVRDINSDPEDRAIVAAIISMSRSLGLQTIAEGVETAEQLALLREQGCDEAQGYYFSKALPAEQFEKFRLGQKTSAG